MDPDENDLIPSNGPGIEPPELAPGYVEKPTAGADIDTLEEALKTTRADPGGFDDGLQLRRAEGGGLHVFKGERIIRDLTDLELNERGTIKNYVEGSR